jgi:O-antigen ligase
MTQPLVAFRSKPVIAGAAASLLLAGLATYQPLYVVLLLAGAGYVLVLAKDPAVGLALFTLLTFFGELGHGASPAKAAGALIVLVWLLRVVRRDGGAPFLAWTRPHVFYAGVGIVAWAGASVLWAFDSGVAESTAIRLALNLMLFIVVPSFVTNRRDLFVVLYAYVFGAALTAAYGVASGNANSDATGRLAGGIGDPNELAALLVPAIILAFLLFGLHRRLFTRVALLFAIAVAVFAMGAAQSRGGLVAMAAAVLAATIWGGRHRGKIVAGVVVALAAAAAAISVGSVALGRFSSFGGGGTGRVDIWSVALRVFRAHPIGGVGIGNFTVVEPSYAAGNLNLPRVDLIVNSQKVTHNTYLNVLADLGLVGFCLFALLIILVLGALLLRVRDVRVGRSDPQLAAIARGLLVSLTGLLVAYAFISAQYEKQLWLLLGVALAAASLPARGLPVESDARLRVVSNERFPR